SQAGDRHFAGFGQYSTTEFADTRLQAGQLPIELFEAADFLVLGTLELAYSESGKAVRRALELAEEYNLKVLLDVNWRPVFWTNPDIAAPTIRELFKQVDFLKLSLEEAEWLFNTRRPREILNHLDSVEGVVVTDGEHGCAYSFEENDGELPAFSVSVADTTGAGDSFVAGLIQQLLIHGMQSMSDPEKAKQIVTYASAVGALTTMKPGAIASQPTAAEVEAFLLQQSK
ncbi:MAG: carbohydrate kinase, partial [Fischerella sp.]|nr:carbohydrate kinase [Fischerella sp.]